MGSQVVGLSSQHTITTNPPLLVVTQMHALTIFPTHAYLWHADVVQKDGHPASGRRAEVLSPTFIELPLDDGLEHPRGGGRREVDPLHQHRVVLEGVEVH